MCSLQVFTTDASCLEIHWDIRLKLPSLKPFVENPGLAGAFSGIVDNHLIVMGGANFPDKKPWEGGVKQWWRTLYSLSLDENAKRQEWQGDDDFLPYSVAYGVSIQLKEGVLCIGGNDANQCYDKVWMVKRENSQWKIDLDWPSLPTPLSCGCGTLLDGKIYLLGGQSSMKNQTATSHFFMLDLNRKEEGWKALPSWPGDPKGYAVCVAQNHSLYLFSGRNYNGEGLLEVHTDGYVYHPEENRWDKIDQNFPVMAGVAMAYGKDKILFLGGVEKALPTTEDHPGFSRKIRCFNVISQSQEVVATSPYPIPVTTNIVVNDRLFYITSGEVKPGIRTPFILRGIIK